jgi:hypothetical protein
MDPTSRLRIATRIHYALLRHLGTGIDVGYMLKRDDYAREVLYVCEGSGDPELAALARKFEQASVEAAMAETRPAPLNGDDTQWAHTSSGSTHLGELDAPRESGSSRWLTPSRWFELTAPPTVH